MAEIKKIRENPGERPAILIVDLLVGKNVRGAVEQFISKSEALSKVDADRIFEINWKEAATPDQMKKLNDELREISSKILERGADVVHVFYAGPAICAMLVGRQLANTVPVLIYHNGTSGYENWGPLRMSY